MQKTFVIGDIHGAHKALVQCLERSGFDKKNDRLISLGDVSDTWPETKLVVKELLKVENFILIQGNHDYLTLQWARTGIKEALWLDQGGKATVESYQNEMSTKHLKFFKSALPYFVEDERCFVHGGFDVKLAIHKQKKSTLSWDRTLFAAALKAHKINSKKPISKFKEVYIGHSPLIRYGFKKPICGGGVWMMDTGAGWSGKLSMMNIDSKEVFQSDYVYKLYPGYYARK